MEDLSEVENKIFYTLGAPIRISNQGCSGLTLFIERKDYKVQELLQSFIEENLTIPLFKTEKEALAYSRFLQTKPPVDSGLDASQRPVFKVEFKGDVTHLSYKKEHIVINDYLRYKPGLFESENMKSEMSVSYCEVKRKEVEPILANLHVYTMLDSRGFNEATYCTYLTLDYTKNIESQLSNNESKCSIS